MNILNQDIKAFEKRLALKNDTILELEETLKRQNTEILKLQDEMLSWKIHASRSDDALN